MFLVNKHGEVMLFLIKEDIPSNVSYELIKTIKGGRVALKITSERLYNGNKNVVLQIIDQVDIKVPNERIINIKQL